MHHNLPILLVPITYFKILHNHLDDLRLTIREVENELVSYFRLKLQKFTCALSMNMLTNEMRFKEALEDMFIIKYFYMHKIFHS